MGSLYKRKNQSVTFCLLIPLKSGRNVVEFAVTAGELRVDLPAPLPAGVEVLTAVPPGELTANLPAPQGRIGRGIQGLDS